MERARCIKIIRDIKQKGPLVESFKMLGVLIVLASFLAIGLNVSNVNIGGLAVSKGIESKAIDCPADIDTFDEVSQSVRNVLNNFNLNPKSSVYTAIEVKDYLAWFETVKKDPSVIDCSVNMGSTKVTVKDFMILKILDGKVSSDTKVVEDTKTVATDTKTEDTTKTVVEDTKTTSPVVSSSSTLTTGSNDVNLPDAVFSQMNSALKVTDYVRVNGQLIAKIKDVMSR